MKRKKNQDSPLITYAEASEISSVSKQCLNQMYHKNNGDYAFFVLDGKKVRIDSSHPDWLDYVKNNRKVKRQGNSQGKQIVDNDPVGLLSPKTGQQSGQEKVNAMQEKAGQEWKREHSLTGGYNPAGFYPQNPAQLKSLTDVTRMNLEMRIRLGELMDRAVVDSYIEKIAQGVMQFVNLGRSVSSQVCHKLDRMGMEKEVEKIVNPKVKNIIEQIIKTCNGVLGKEVKVRKVRKQAGKKKPVGKKDVAKVAKKTTKKATNKGVVLSKGKKDAK